jgi:hypothetical protein
MGVLGCNSDGRSFTDSTIRCEVNHIQQR